MVFSLRVTTRGSRQSFPLHSLHSTTYVETLHQNKVEGCRQLRKNCNFDPNLLALSEPRLKVLDFVVAYMAVAGQNKNRQRDKKKQTGQNKQQQMGQKTTPFFFFLFFSSLFISFCCSFPFLFFFLFFFLRFLGVTGPSPGPPPQTPLLPDPPPPDRPNFSLFFFSLCHPIFALFFFLSNGLLVEFWWFLKARALKCARLGSSNVHI